MDHTIRPTVSLKNDEFLKVFLALLIADGVLKLGDVIMSWSAGFGQQPTALNIITSILSFAVLVMAIIMWVRSVKRKYPKSILWTSILRVFVPLVLGILGAVIGAMLTFNTFAQMNIDVNQEPPAEIPAQIMGTLKWLSIIPVINGLLFIGLGVNALVKMRKE